MATLQVMKALALTDCQSVEVRSLAESLGHPVAVEAFIRASWRIVPDPDGVEYVQAPIYQIHLADENGFFSGDCDDSATLAASLLAALCQRCSLIAIRMPAEPEFSHVFARAFVNGRAYDIDPIVPVESLPIRGIAETMEVTVL